MDLISTLIQSKKEADIPLEAYFKELIKYVKLAKNKKFEHIEESTLLQKQMPLCWQAFNNDPNAYYLVLSIAGIVQNTGNQPVQLIDDLLQHYNQKTKRQYQVIGQANGLRFVYQDIRQLDYRLLDNHGLFYLIEKIDEKEIRMSAIHKIGHTINVYTGNVHLDATAQRPSPHIQPYHYKTDDSFVEINAYSIQGNNDYEFAKTKQYYVQMPNNHSFDYRDKQTNQIIHIELDDGDVQFFAIRKSIEILSMLIAKYEPKGDNNETRKHRE